MAGWKGVYTQKGLALLAKLTPSGTLNITRAVVGTGVVNEADLSKQTKVTDIKQELAMQPPTYPERGTCKLPVVLANDKVGAAYTARQIGFYATDPSEGEILYFIAQSSTGTSILPESEIPGYTATWTFYFNYGEADSVTVKVDPSNAVTKEMLDEVRVIAERGVSDQGYGEIIVMEDTANLPFAGFKVYGKSTQDGIPTPDAPVDIVNVGGNGSVGITVHGKNLLDHNAKSTTISGVTITVNSDGTIDFSGKATDNIYFYMGDEVLLPPGTYHLSGTPSGGSQQTYYTYVYPGYPLDSGDGATFTLETETSCSVRVFIAKDFTCNYLTFKPQIEIGSVGTGYVMAEKQIASISTPNGLRGIPVDKGGNYTDATGQQWICDEIDLVRGVYIQRIGYVQQDGIYGHTQGTHGNGQHYASITLPGVATNGKVLSNRYQNAAWSNENNRIYRINKTGVITDSRFVDQATATAILKEEMPEMIYPLAVPVETPLDLETLYCQNPVTTIINDSGAEMFVDCIRSNNENAFRLAASSKHTHEIAEVNGLQDALNAKENKSTTATATLLASGWTADGEEYAQTVTVTGMLPDKNIVVGSHPNSNTAYKEAGVYCSEQDTDALVFKATDVPESDLVANILMIGG